MRSFRTGKKQEEEGRQEPVDAGGDTGSQSHALQPQPEEAVHCEVSSRSFGVWLPLLIAVPVRLKGYGSATQFSGYGNVFSHVVSSELNSGGL